MQEGFIYDSGSDLALFACRFTGKERDAESGLDYFGARYYGSSMGRFMSPDWSAQAEPVPYAKLDDPQSLNLYAYVLNNPLKNVDPDGHFLDHGMSFCAAGSSEISAGCSPAEKEQIQTEHRQQAEQDSADAKRIAEDFAKNKSRQYSVVIARMKQLLGDKADGINFNQALNPACNLAGGNCQFKPNSNQQGADLTRALNDALGTPNSGGSRYGIQDRAFGITSLHYDFGQFHVDHFNPFSPLGLPAHFAVDVVIGSFLYGTTAAFSY